jgi:hypothetical protein
MDTAEIALWRLVGEPEKRCGPINDNTRTLPHEKAAKPGLAALNS